MTQLFLPLCVLLLQILYFRLVFLTWKKTGSIGLLLIHACFYYYTFHIYILVAFFQDFELNPLRILNAYKVEKDPTFYLSWLLLLFFGNVYSGTLLYLSPLNSSAGRKSLLQDKFCVSPLIFLISGIFILNIWLWRNSLSGFLNSRVIGYMVFKRGELLFGPWYPAVRLSLEFAGQALCFLLAYSLGLLPSRKNTQPWGRFCLILSSCVLFALGFLFFVAMGDRQSLISGLIFATVLIFTNKEAWLRKLLVTTSIFLLINTIAVVRTLNLNSQTTGIQELKMRLFNLVFTGESVSSLSMYKLIEHQLPRFNGASIHFFFSALIPRFIKSHRPLSPYEYFTRGVGIDSNSGVGFHYGTDWYMNYGLFGLVVGAVLLGVFHSFVFRQSLKNSAWCFVFAGMIGGLPLFQRNALDFKGTFYSMLLAFFVFLASTSPTQWNMPLRGKQIS